MPKSGLCLIQATGVETTVDRKYAADSEQHTSVHCTYAERAYVVRTTRGRRSVVRIYAIRGKNTVTGVGDSRSDRFDISKFSRLLTAKHSSYLCGQNLGCQGRERGLLFLQHLVIWPCPPEDGPLTRPSTAFPCVSPTYLMLLH